MQSVPVDRAATCRVHFGPMVREMMVGKKELEIQVTDLTDENALHVCHCRRRAVFYITRKNQVRRV